MNTSEFIKLTADLQGADQAVKHLMHDALALTHKANFANDNVANVIKTWGEDSDIAELAKAQMYQANAKLIAANRLVAAAIGRHTELSDKLAAIQQVVAL